MTLRPRVPKDLALAPVAARIDMNLQWLRDRSEGEIDDELQMQLGGPAVADSRHERSTRVLAVALRDVELHDWDADITEDAARLRLSGGSISLDLGLSAALLSYIEGANGNR